MRLEGNIRQSYYQAFDIIIQDFEMGRRSKQPPTNEINALISFGKLHTPNRTLQELKR